MEQSNEIKEVTQDLDLLTKMQAEIDALRHENERLRVESNKQDLPPKEQNEENVENFKSRRSRRLKRQQVDVMKLHTSPAIQSEDKEDHSSRNLKIFAAIATAVVVLVLFNTVGLFGIALLGLIAGGLIK